jgi:biotin carboxylase
MSVSENNRLFSHIGFGATSFRPLFISVFFTLYSVKKIIRFYLMTNDMAVVPRLLLLLPTSTYRTEAFMTAAQQLGVAITVASEQASSLSHHNPDGLLALDFRNPKEAARQVAQFAKEHPISAVVGVDDETVILAAIISKALALPHNSVESVSAARNKYVMRQRLLQAGVPVPRFDLFSIDDEPAGIARAITFPCIVKPLHLSASRGVIRANDEAEFVAAFNCVAALLRTPEIAGSGDVARRILVESFISGQEVALEGLLIRGQLQALALFDKPDPLEGPFFQETIYVTPSRLPASVQTEIISCTAWAADALGLREGPVHAELRVNADGPWVIEINPRSIGGRCSRMLRFGTGMTLEELILRHALGLEIPSLERERQPVGVMMIPIPRAGGLKDVRGHSDAQAVPGIAEVMITAYIGQELVPLPEGSRYLGFMFARGESPEFVESALREAHRRLEFVIE